MENNTNSAPQYTAAEVATEYARRTARLAELVAEAEGDLELIGFHHERFARWCAFASKNTK